MMTKKPVFSLAALFVCACLALCSLARPDEAHAARSARFGSNAAQNASLFVAPPYWLEFMSKAKDLYANEGQLGCYGRIVELPNVLASQNLQYYTVEDLKESFALAAYLYYDKMMAEETLKQARTDMERMGAGVIARTHEENIQNFVNPITVLVKIASKIGLSEQQFSDLMNNLLQVFYALFNN